MNAWSIEELGRAYRAGGLRPTDVTKQYLERIERLNAKLTAFTCVTAERALAEAEAADAALQRGEDQGPLHGVPYAVKEHFNVAGVPTMVGCRHLANNIPEIDCAAVRRLNDAGMILLGKTHSQQLGGGITGINQDVGTPHNPWNEVHHVPGGSSSGSGVAVAADLTLVALGGDTGGSVRVPASLCGIVGLKTTVGRISRAGVYPMSVTLDTVGVLSRRVKDAALVYDCLQGHDQDDNSTFAAPTQDALADLDKGAAGLRVAMMENLVFEDADPEVEVAIRRAGDIFEELGARVSSMVVPEFSEVHALVERYVINAVETFVHNERLIEDHGDQLDPIVGWIKSAKTIPAIEYFRVKRTHTDLQERIRDTLSEVDVLLLPATLLPSLPLDRIAPSLGNYVEPYKDDPSERYTRNMSIGNMLGLCGLSVPCGFTGIGLPIGLGIYAKPFDEATLLRAGLAYENATEWHRRRPDLSWAGA